MELVLQADFEIFVLVSFFSVSSQYIFNHPEGTSALFCKKFGWTDVQTNKILA